MATIKYGIVGYSKNEFDQKRATQILKECFEKIKKKHPHAIVEIVSGYTNTGVPKIAYELADQFGFVTVGFSAEQALNVRCGVYPVQKVILKGSYFGDESEYFVRYINALIRVGGGPQSRHETALFKAISAQQPLNDLLQEFEVE
ncbi:MAG: hypothetical protein AB8E82_18090 [Aureispira sp.]